MNEDLRLEAFKKEMATLRKIINDHISTHSLLSNLELKSLILQEKKNKHLGLEAPTPETGVRCCDGNNKEVFLSGEDFCNYPYRDLPCK